METIRHQILKELSEAGLKVTPQRMAVLEVLKESSDHPTADAIHRKVLDSIPGISATTIYNTLDTFVDKGLVKRVKTDAGIMRYEPMSGPHHHLYCLVSDRMEDYFDPDLDRLLEDYFRSKKIKDFDIRDIRLQIMGDFGKGLQGK